MAIRRIYLLLAVVGVVVPMTQFVPWVSQHGLDIPAVLAELFSTRIGGFFGLDVLVSAVVVLVLIVHDGRRARVSHLWVPAAATCAIGVSCGLPLYLYLRERSAAPVDALSHHGR